MKYSWLIYSRKENGGYCLPCVLFARSTDARKGKGVFIEAAFTNCTKLVITMLRGNTTRLLLLPVMLLWNG